MPIEAREYTDKNELIGQFYTLRAGLSAIAEETGKIRKGERAIKDWKETDKGECLNPILQLFSSKRDDDIVAAKDRVLIVEQALDAEKEELAQCYHKRLSLREECDRYQNDEAFKRDIQKRAGISVFDNLKGILIGGAIASCVSVLPLVFYFEHSQGVSDLAAELYVIIHLVLCTILFSVVGLIISISKNNKLKEAHLQKEYEHRLGLLRDAENQYEEIENCIREKQVEIDRLNALVNTAVQSKEKYQDHLAQLEQNLTCRIIPASTAAVQQITRVLHEQFDHLLSETDWQNVDLLIFYLETGRADSLKEALQLVDRQRQTNQITHAVSAAANHISGAIHTASVRLGEAMYCGFRDLGNRMNQHHREMMSAVERSGQAMQSLKERFDSVSTQIQQQGSALLDAEHLSAALLEQSNKSSEELVAELRYNREFWKNKFGA